MSNILSSYVNGNCHVTIYSDGTKIREYEGEPKPVHPESFDCKITNRCPGVPRNGRNEICAWCHERASFNGAHADLDALMEVISCLPAGVEVALGGGSPLTHPNIISFLHKLQEQGLIANITMNQSHLETCNEMLIDLIQKDLIKGIGVSYHSDKMDYVKQLLKVTDNVVFHLIMGINPVEDVSVLQEYCTQQKKACKILILGYKTFGNGIEYIKNHNIEDNKYQWYTRLASHFHEERKYPTVISFDNLAIKQMNLKRYFTDESWNRFYMGNDGSYTLYIDAVKQQYAKSSTSTERVSFNDMDLLTYFSELRNAQTLDS